MKVSEAFPSKYLKTSDLQGRNVRAIIQGVETEKVGDDQKLVLYFKGKTKGMVLNKTNATTIAEEYGDDTDGWAGNEVILYGIMTEYQGKPTEGLRVRRPTAKDNPAKTPARPVQHEPDDQRMAAGADEEIPF